MEDRVLMQSFKSERLKKLANDYLEESLYWFLGRNGHLVDYTQQLAKEDNTSKTITDNHYHLKGGLTVTYTITLSPDTRPIIKTELRVSDGQSNPKYKELEDKVYLESTLDYLTIFKDAEYMSANQRVGKSTENKDEEVRDNIEYLIERIYLQFARQFYK